MHPNATLQQKNHWSHVPHLAAIPLYFSSDRMEMVVHFSFCYHDSDILEGSKKWLFCERANHLECSASHRNYWYFVEHCSEVLCPSSDSHVLFVWLWTCDLYSSTDPKPFLSVFNFMLALFCTWLTELTSESFYSSSIWYDSSFFYGLRFFSLILLGLSPTTLRLFLWFWFFLFLFLVG